MLVYKRINDLKAYIVVQKAKNLSIGFVPTMGALHEGHMSLIKKSVAENDLTVCSIFVNPTQFNVASDLEKYPITIDSDVKMLVKHNNSILFLPSVEEIYPNGDTYDLDFEFGNILNIHEGAFRPGHFEGMIQVVHRLLDIVKPHNIYMGQKDYQQAMIVNKLIQEAQLETKLVVCPIHRRESGLAMSSRNKRLSEDAINKATILSKTLNWVNDNISTIPLDELQSLAIQKITNKGFKVDYFNIANATTLEDITDTNSEQKVALVAAWIDGIRLIDNKVLDI